MLGTIEELNARLRDYDRKVEQIRRHGEKIAQRDDKSAKKRAVVAVTRKLAVLLHRLWITAEHCEPLHNAQRLGGKAA